MFHEILEHRWYLSEQRGKEQDLMETARDYFSTRGDPGAPLTELPEVATLPDSRT